MSLSQALNQFAQNLGRYRSCLRETDTGNLKNPVFFARTNDDLICFHC